MIYTGGKCWRDWMGNPKYGNPPANVLFPDAVLGGMLFDFAFADKNAMIRTFVEFAKIKEWGYARRLLIGTYPKTIIAAFAERKGLRILGGLVCR